MISKRFSAAACARRFGKTVTNAAAAGAALVAKSRRVMKLRDFIMGSSNYSMECLSIKDQRLDLQIANDAFVRSTVAEGSGAFDKRSAKLELVFGPWNRFLAAILRL